MQQLAKFQLSSFISSVSVKTYIKSFVLYKCINLSRKALCKFLLKKKLIKLESWNFANFCKFLTINIYFFWQNCWSFSKDYRRICKEFWAFLFKKDIWNPFYPERISVKWCKRKTRSSSLIWDINLFHRMSRIHKTLFEKYYPLQYESPCKGQQEEKRKIWNCEWTFLSTI